MPSLSHSTAQKADFDNLQTSLLTPLYVLCAVEVNKISLALGASLNFDISVENFDNPNRYTPSLNSSKSFRGRRRNKIFS